MANSQIITSLKDSVLKAIMADETFFYAIDPDTEKEDETGNRIEDCGDLFNKYVFNYNKNPETISDTMTFLTVVVETNYRDFNKTFITPVLTIWVYSHYDHMEFTDATSKILGFDTRITDNRNDYIGKLLDLKFNGMSTGIGKLNLVSNTEGNASRDFLYRRLIFETIDLNDSLCGGD